MKPTIHPKLLTLGGLALAAATLLFTPAAKANVYATNIKLNGSLTNANSAQGASVAISYILNEPATLGTVINIISNVTVIDTISISTGSAGTLRGLNTVTWGGTNTGGSVVPIGSYSVSITPSATGYVNWTQISVDSTNTAAVYPHGIDVDKNPSSLYYGRVVVGSPLAGTAHGVTQKVGLYKANADGSPADEGTFGYAGYTTNDDGVVAVGQMASARADVNGNNLRNPYCIRIGEDDRIYWTDCSYCGAVVACDILATTNQVVITSGTNGPYGPSPGNPTNPHNYGGTPEVSLIDGPNGVGISQFDVINTTTTNAAVILVDTGDFPSWGAWLYRMTNGASDTNDTVGTKVVVTGEGDLIVTSAGIAFDTNLDIFVSETRSGATDPLQRTFCYNNWNGGVLPPENSGNGYAVGLTGAPAFLWAVGTADPYMTAINDTAINSRTSPTMVAVSMAAGAAVTGGYTGLNGGVRVLSAIDGSTIITNLDLANYYDGVAFDNVGNVYAGSRSANYWRVWSPPGANTNTTVAVAHVQVTGAVTPPTITSIAVSGGTVTIKFSGSTSDAAAAFTLYSSSNVLPASGYGAAGGATIIQLSPGSFQATVTASGSSKYYRIKR